jgi:hypothetical protein
MTGGDDDKARAWADGCFIRERLQALDPSTKRDASALEDAYRRIILDLLRTRTPSRRTLQQVADELERLWWPSKKRARRSREQVFLWHADDMTNSLADRYREKGVRNPRTRAEKVTARVLGIGGVAGLRQRRAIGSSSRHSDTFCCDTFEQKVS